MKKINIIFFALLIIFSACEQNYIDEITAFDPGSDSGAPTVTITSPTEGTLLKVAEGAGFPIFLEAMDDIELQSVSILIDGNEVDEITSFKDYRRYSPINGHVISNYTDGSHTLKVVATDLSGKSVTSNEIKFGVITLSEFVPTYGEKFYMPMDGLAFEFASLTDGTVVGSPTFTTSGKIGGAYVGAADSYISFPMDGLMGDEFSVSFWYNLGTNGRAGLVTVSPPGINTRTSGFRLFRENGPQILKGNVGVGGGEAWVDGGDPGASIVGYTGTWIHIAFSISQTNAIIYVNGEVIKDTEITGIDWTDCENISIGSGQPYFVGWNHLWDDSMIDEVRIFDKALTQADIQTMYNAEK